MRMVQDSLHDLRMPTSIIDIATTHHSRPKHNCQILHRHFIDVAVCADPVQMQN